MLLAVPCLKVAAEQGDNRRELLFRLLLISEMSSRKSFLLRLDPALYAALEGWAEQEMRSVNGQIEFILKQAVLARDRKALPNQAEDQRSDEPAN